MDSGQNKWQWTFWLDIKCNGKYIIEWKSGNGRVYYAMEWNVGIWTFR